MSARTTWRRCWRGFKIMDQSGLSSIWVSLPLYPSCHKLVNSQFISQFPVYFPHQSLTLLLQASMIGWVDGKKFNECVSPSPGSATGGVSQTCQSWDVRGTASAQLHRALGPQEDPGSALRLREGIPMWIPRVGIEGHSSGNRSTRCFLSFRVTWCAPLNP
jgi:hypothetical protein